MRFPVILVLLILCVSNRQVLAAHIDSISDNGPSVRKYGKFEATYDLGRTYQNPFDPAEIDVTVLFTSPKGVIHSVAGFLYQDYTRGEDLNGQTLIPLGKPVWKVRFTPDEEGTWFYVINAKDASGSVSTPQRTFQVSASDSKGFVHVSAKDPDYFALDDGSTYFPIGENMGWPGKNRTYDYDKWVAALADAGGNYIRVWQAPWNTEIEWADSYDASTLLPGNYTERLKQAWELDHILDLCEQKDVYVMLCLVNHGKFSSKINPNWDQNPYNKKANPKSGFLDNPGDVWTNDKVRIYLQRNWHYLIARYAGYTSLMSWELFNEMEWIDDYKKHVADSAEFHQVMGNYLKANDPYHHLVTTSYASALKWPKDVWNAGMQYTQEHNYGGLDLSQIASITSQMRTRYPDKPFYLGEIGLDAEGKTERQADPTGIYIHNTNWASLTAKAAGGGFPWWWDNYIDPNNLYWRWTGIARFLSGEEMDKRGYVPANFTVETQDLSDFAISPGQNGWGIKAPSNQFVLSPDGTITPSESSLTGYVYGSEWNTEYRNPPTFHLKMKSPGKFSVKLKTVSTSGDNRLTITLDGKPTTVNESPAVPDSIYEVDVPEGSHDLFVDSTGQDWVQVSSYVVSDYVPALRCQALNGKGRILGWVQSRSSAYGDKTLPKIKPAILKLTDLNPDGQWKLEWWDTDKGVETGSQQISVSNGSADIPLPAINNDLAFKAYESNDAK